MRAWRGGQQGTFLWGTPTQHPVLHDAPEHNHRADEQPIPTLSILICGGIGEEEWVIHSQSARALRYAHFSFVFLVFQALPSEIQGWGGDKSRKSAIGDLWEMLDGEEKARMPGSPTAQGERILGAGSQGRAPRAGWGMLQSWVRGGTSTFRPLSRAPR